MRPSRLLALLPLLALAAASRAQLDFLGNTKVFAGATTYGTGGAIPARGAYLQPGQTLSVTTQTYPVAPGQSVVAVVTTDGFATTREIPLSYDRTVGNNTGWGASLGPYPAGTDVAFYLRATGNGGGTLYDSAGGGNYAFTWRRAPRVRRGAILQWFATDDRTILRRLPEVVEAGYGAIYLPPPQKSGGGGFSVGYNPLDRFDLGDRLQGGSVATRYGTTADLQDLVRAAHRYGLEVYCDLVPNHNANRANVAIDRYPGMIPEDFHIRSSGDTTNREIDFNRDADLSYEMLDGDLVGLADVAHEDGNLAATGPFVLPPYAAFDANGKPSFVRDPLTPQYYPGETPAPEDVRGYLRRWGWYLASQIGFDGFRIDAAKHTPPAFFGKAQNGAPGGSLIVSSPDLLPYLYGLKRDLMVFAEVLTGDGYELREYAKTGLDPLNFPLANRLNDVFNANGFGDMGSLAGLSGIDPATGLGYDHGGLDEATGVSFIQSHDNGPPRSNNLATAFALTRPGNSIVYYDGNNLDPNDYGQFPRPGRFEALGDGGDGTLRVLDARARFARGTIYNRYVTSDLFVYERQTPTPSGGAATLLVGLNDRGDAALTVTVDTAFPPGTLLRDLAGGRPDVTVGGDGKATITVPANSAPGNDNNARGYVLYAPPTPRALAPVAVADAGTGAPLPSGSITMPGGSRASARTLPTLVASGGALDVSLSTDAGTGTGTKAFLKLDDGLSYARGVSGLRNTREGLADGFLPMTGSGGAFSLGGLDVSALPDGLHLLRVRTFAGDPTAPGTAPLLYGDATRWIEVRRGLGTGWTVDGDLTEFGPSALVFQSRAPSSSANRLDGLFVDNDDQYLYVGLAGRVDPAEGFTNGMALAIDDGSGAGFGLSDLSLSKDDSGPAGRLLSNARLALPPGFFARYALASFRGARLGSSPELATPGSPALAPIVGATAGAFVFNRTTPYRLNPLPAAIAYAPRASVTGPFAGLEAAIPLRNLFPNSASPYQRLRFVAWLVTTGETGTILPASDPARAATGGRAPARGYLTNQFLPPQAGIAGDPGTAPATLDASATYSIRRATYAPGLRVGSGPVTITGPGASEATLTVTNTSGTAVAGPIRVMVGMAPNDVTRIANRAGTTLFGGAGQYLLATPGPLGPGESVTLAVRYAGGRFAAPQVAFTPYVGRGAL